MCGLSGYILRANDKRNDDIARIALLCGLATGIDKRGGHAAGWAGVDDAGLISVERGDGTWESQSAEFLTNASKHNVCLMHARYATMGAKIVENAHPFTITRGDGEASKVKLVGAHNGCLTGTWSSASEHNREQTVDSLELFHLLADGELDAIQELDGYGVITWVEPGSSDVFVCRLSKRSDFYAIALPGKLGVVWGSTKEIVQRGLIFADIDGGKELDLPEVGRVYRLSVDGVKATETAGVEVGKKRKPYSYPTTRDYGDTYDYFAGERSYAYGSPLTASSNHSRSYTPSEYSRGFDAGKMFGIRDGREQAAKEAKIAGEASFIERLFVTQSGVTWAKVGGKWCQLPETIWNGMRPRTLQEWHTIQDRTKAAQEKTESVFSGTKEASNDLPLFDEESPATQPTGAASTSEPRLRVEAWSCGHGKSLAQECTVCDEENGVLSPESEDEWIETHMRSRGNFQG